MAVIGNAPFQGLVSGGNIIDASIEGVDLSTSAIAARLGYTPVDPGAAAIIGGTINGTTIGATTAAAGSFTTVSASGAVTLNGLTASTALALDASKNLVSVTNTGSGNNVLATSPTLVTPVLGTPTSGNFSTGTFTWPTFNQNTTGTAAGLSATLATASGGTGLTAFTSGGIVYASSTGALATGSALTFDGTKLTSTTLSIAGPTGPVTASNERITVSNSYDGTVLGKMYAAPATNQKYLNAGWNVSTYGSGASGYMINGVTGIYRSSAGSSLYVAADQHLFGSLSADGFTNASPTFAEYMRITSAGNVGIGNTNPGARLVVSGSGNIVRLGDGTNTFDVRFQGPNNWAQQLDTTNDVMNFQRNSISLVTFTSGGKVGIGTTGPVGKLSVLGAFGTDTTAGLAITSTGSTTGLVAPMAFYLQSSGWGTVHQANIYAQQVSGTDGGANILFSTATTGQFAPTERMRISSAGDLGVGTGIQANANYQFGQSLTDSYGTIPGCTIGRRLGVTGSANSPVISLAYYSSAYGMDLWVGTTGLSPVYLDVRQNESLIFRNNTFTGTARETMRISSAGGLSIGSTVNPGAGNILLPGTSGTIFANDTTNSRSYIELYNTSTGDMSLATTYTTASIRFLTGGTTTPTERMRIASTGKIGIGQSAPNALVHIGSETEINITNQALFVQGTKSQYAGVNGLCQNQVFIYDDTAGSAGSGGAISFGANTGSSQRTWIAAIESRRDSATTDASNYAGSLVFYTRPAQSPSEERMRITSDGSVGIGTTPNRWFSNRKALQLGGSVGAISMQNGYEIGLNFYVVETTAAEKRVQSGYANKVASDAAIGDIVWSTAGTGAANSNITWNEKMRLTNGGRLLVGTTTTTFPINFRLASDSGDWFARYSNTTSNQPYGSVFEYTAAAPNGSVNEFIFCVDTGAQRMSVRSNGGIANYQANNANLSDRREKTNFAPAKSYLDIICAIPVQTFNYIDQNLEQDGGLTLGVVAQDVQAVAPELVMESNWGTKEDSKMRLSIYQTDLQYALMKCIQEQQAMIVELQQEVAILKGGNA